MNKKITMIFMLLLISVMVIACKKEDKTTTNDNNQLTTAPTVTTAPTAVPADTTFAGPLAGIMTKEDYPVVDGSTATIPLSEAVYQLATGATKEEAAADIIHTKTSNAYYRLMKKEADLLIVYEPSEQVLADLKSGGCQLNIKPIGKDALVFMANSSNPVKSLTEEQLINIYSGKTTNWSEVGGENKEIRAFQRPENSGSQTLMLKLVMGELPMMTGPKAVSYETMEGILEAMASYSNEGNTIGYSVFYYAQNMYQLPELRFMKVNGVEPSLQSIYDGSYPYINEFYAVIREEEPSDSNAYKLFDWLTGEEGQTLVKEVGYVPMNMKITDKEVASEALLEDTLPEGYQYIGTSYSSESGVYNGTVTIYSQDWQPIKVFQNANAIGYSGLVKEDTILPIGCATYQEDGTYSMMYGLYSLKEGRFLLPINYKYMSELDAEKGYYIVSASENYQVIDLQENVLATGFMLGEGYGISKHGDYYWLIDYNTEKGIEVYKIYDSEFNLIKEFERDYEKCELFDNDGTVYFSKDMFYKKFGYKMAEGDDFYLQSYNNEEPLISVSYKNNILIMDRKLNVLAQKEKVTDNYSYYNVFYDIFSDSVYNNQTFMEDGLFYDKKGNVITDASGNTFSSIVTENYWLGEKEHEQVLYKFKDGTLNIFKYNSGEQISINTGDWNVSAVSLVYGDVVLLNQYGDVAKTRIYKGSELLYDLEGVYNVDYSNDSSITKGSLFVKYSEAGNQYILINKNGETLYESEKNETIHSIDDKYIQISRGNYWGVMDYQGNAIIKAIKQELMND